MDPKPAVDVIICVYVPGPEAFGLLERCVSSVIHRTRRPHRLILLNDCSPHPGVSEYLHRTREKHVEREILVVENATNLGFVATANRALALGPGRDVVLLNNDTEVTTGWLGRMIRCAYSSERIATVTPFSNNATLFSIPRMHVENPLPDGYSAEDVAKVVLRHSPGCYPEVPTGHGFCLYIKRQALDEVGAFDQVNFGKGYGEENDFCCRCSEHGYIHALDDLTFVWHRGEASFQGKREAVTQKHFQTLVVLHSWFYDVIVEFEKSDPLRHYRRLFEAVFRTRKVPDVDLELARPAKQPHVLFVNTVGGKHNGLVRYTRELLPELARDSDVFVLTSNGTELSLSHPLPEARAVLPLPERLTWNRMFANGAYRVAVEHWLDTLDIQLVHLNSLEGHTFDLVDAARRRGIPVVYVVHDFLLVCPTKFLVDRNTEYCQTCACGSERAGCLEDHPLVGKGTAALLGHFRAYIRRHVLPHLTCLVAPSNTAARIFTSIYPETAERMIVVPHGTTAERLGPGYEPEPGRLHVGILGALHPLKGLGEVRALIARAGQERFRFTLFGSCSETLDGLVVRGEYDYERVIHMMRNAGIQVVLIFSKGAETYSYTLTEAIRAGIPVVANRAGALPERIEALGAGWVVDARDTKAVHLLLERLRTDPGLLSTARARLARLELPSREDWGSTYAGVYAKCHAATTPHKARERSGPSLPKFAMLEALQSERERQRLEERLSSIERSLPVRLARMARRSSLLAALMARSRGAIDRMLS